MASGRLLRGRKGTTHDFGNAAFGEATVVRQLILADQLGASWFGHIVVQLDLNSR